MNPIVKNVLAVIGALIIGSLVNMGLVIVGHSVFPIEGVDYNDREALQAVMPTLDFKYFIFPFLAHAAGTLVGAFVAYKLAADNKMKISLGLGVIFFILGIVASQMIPAPTWFVIVDLLFAYIPMAWIGAKIASR